ncbi:RNA polymerase, sigma-24 subunit, ECF subfamily [Beutenbergia cavernae DSM 12333]|uniref:RNA polymerase, sigma-24 subunit, ECF subfamily n=1 Tax=Beutenbergia cavernae (strain ATCC BAA-8 / DSM 12333 / CCUG 43141 / JCM 11478 / NBRC 16432 / NCIMB 13614 / HKI 0122) TaxID=471853 RepID=C5BXY0_BEUC1|nr:sigma-70 family RNA polymerase sigma factor [Beutenbergia cavernae]ACQ78874.1 RNA polymerase, sigma-24 subunit, ECF subfamily [Beutenbergia cavernae DSM 12333]
MKPRSEDRLRELWLAHAADVHRFAQRALPHHDAEEVVSETFVVAWRRLADVPEDARPWLFATARNIMMTRARSTGRRYALIARIEREPTTTPEPTDEQALARHDLARAWLSLYEQDRECLALIVWEGLSNRDAARVVGCSPTAFAVRVMRARRRFEKALEDKPEPRPLPIPLGATHEQD